MSGNTVLGKFVGKCLGKDGHGVNIEGLAARNGKLYFGFREPAINKMTYILRVSADALFSGGDLLARLFTVEAGKASGIRDLLAVPEGLLLLIGPDDDSKNVPWRIAFWDSSEVTSNIVPRPLAELTLPAVTGKDCQKEMKPEALTLIEDGKDFRRVLILSDGMCDGGPLIFRIPK
jgi:hypothetical protein